ncbi:MAG: hypothetical protein GC162_02480 [Planctomycetes bacterium]|nr:hypothetical protein [Planctomycetota bacterium]
MGDITNPRVLWVKFFLFVGLGVLAGATALVLFADVRLAGLLVLCVWGFCRAYYFAFYVIEHYVDASYKFSGLGSFVRYMMGTRRGPGA